jgi:uncharacterized surface protein with fasciclin (FAS1) repeats
VFRDLTTVLFFKRQQRSFAMKFKLALTSCLVLLIATSSTFAGKKKDIVDTAVKAGSFKTLVTAVKAAGLVETLKGEGPFTVFAPTDDAFAKLPKGTVESLIKPENKSALQGILTYHVVAGKVMAKDAVKVSNAKTVNGQQVNVKVKKADGKTIVMIDGATVIATDIKCSNGVIHVIDQVILPSDKDIVDTAVSAGSFKTLVAAVKAAGLVETLQGKGPFTVLAPTDEAFAKLPKGTIASLLKPENKKQLQAILTYHVIPGRAFASDVVKMSSAKTVQGSAIKISTAKGVMINESKVTATDIDASNGVIHVIDTVLLPPKDNKSARRGAKHMIEGVITKGSHLYNRGHAKMCADLYTMAAHKLMTTRNLEMSDKVSHHIHAAMKVSKSSHCHDTRAWTMRRALDNAYLALK